jgi:hypothetical protein
VSAATTFAAPELLGRPVFTVGGRQFRWSDVVERVDWDSLRKAAARPATAGDRELADAEARFRYDRNLVAAEEMETWLASWGVTVREWRDHLRRELAADATPSTTVDDERAVWAEAVCSGALEQAARELAAAAAAAEATGEPDLARARERLLANAMSGDALEALVRTRHTDWIRADCRTLVLPNEPAAREAALCIRDDGMALAEVAAQARVEMREHSVYLEDATDELGKALLSARTGELVGPLPLADRHVLVLVDDKVEPTLGDPEILRRAQEAARRRAIEREVVNRVTWHERI